MNLSMSRSDGKREMRNLDLMYEIVLRKDVLKELFS
jgi:hypothetical protein